MLGVKVTYIDIRIIFSILGKSMHLSLYLSSILYLCLSVLDIIYVFVHGYVYVDLGVMEARRGQGLKVPRGCDLFNLDCWKLNLGSPQEQ